ncbi:MAG: methionine adenosyltransferase [Alphaproteobacteria bacterium]
MTILVGAIPEPAVEALEVEMVERKGLGHPDSICDSLAEQLSIALSRFYRDRFGLILHHNVDKVLLLGGEARATFGGGEVLKPIEVFLAGRATREFRGTRVPVEDLAVECWRRWLGETFRALDPVRHVVPHVMVRPGSADLVELYLRQARAGAWLANDTSCGVGHAPLSRLERAVLAVERRLNSPETKRLKPAVGEDIKVMGVRQGERVHLTVACAFIARHAASMSDYLEHKAAVAEIARKEAEAALGRDSTIEVNTADDPRAGSAYLTVTGTSAEAGDDGEAGRGNRSNGLITPYRPMTMESVAGKNPVTHVGKLYNLTAGLIAAAVVDELDGVAEAQCHLVSQIGRPIADPLVADVKIRASDGRPVRDLDGRVREIAADRIARVGSLSRDILDGRLAFDRWPFHSSGGPVVR